MVPRFFTAVIEKNATFTADFETEPYEAGWAREARWFVRVLEFAGRPLVVKPQVSPDGLVWCDEGNHQVSMGAAGLYSFAMRDFGGWLRLRGEVAPETRAKMIVYLALKQ